MSVLIKGMEMPTCCAVCDLHNSFSKTPYCRRLLKVIPIEGRLENCPLVEVPTPHLRLIDADDLRCERADFDTYRDYSTMFDEIDNAPTVIEAEE